MAEDIDSQIQRIRGSIESRKKSAPSVSDREKPDEERNVFAGVEELLDKGGTIEISKKGGRYVVREASVVSRWFLASVVVNALLVAVLATKILGLW